MFYERAGALRPHGRVVCLTAVLTICVSGTALAQSASTANVRASTHIVVTPAPTSTAAPQFGGPPVAGYFYEDPASLACVYGLVNFDFGFGACNPNWNLHNPSGGSKTIAVVDAFDDPTAATDLAVFSAQFGVSAPSNFHVVYAPGVGNGTCNGSASTPGVDPTGGWEIEESLDIEYAHAMAPAAKLYLVEAQSDSLGDLFCAVLTASGIANTAGGGEVNMSWGAPEGALGPAETSLDGFFTTPNVVYFASTGDTPGVSYPAASPNVVSVGGTSIGRNPATGSFIAETAWQLGGGGPSAYEPRPGFQRSIQNIVGNSRGTPDLALDGNPVTGVWVFDSFGTPSWYIVGGTSVSSVVTAAIVNASNYFPSSSSAALTAIYSEPNSAFNSIRVGSCGPYSGYFATNGWDFCTGLGSPDGYLRINPNSNNRF